jgi:16S rRNA (guanine527-N7)-methyltransferase
MAYPGISDDLLASIEEPNPLDVALLRSKVDPFATPPDGPLKLILDYGRLLLAANQRMNLTGAKDWDRLIPSHFVDCLEAARFIPEDVQTIADWGSGAGLPGVIWSILFPEKHLLLCEKRNKRAEFLNDILHRLEIFQAEVLAGQAEVELKKLGRVDALSARAVEPLGKLLPRIRKHRISFGALFLMVGPSWETDWKEMSAKDKSSWKLAAHHPYSLPGDLGSRAVLVFRPGS